MSESKQGVGVNGEPDDFGSRYDRMVDGRGTFTWVVRTIVAVVVFLGAIGLAGYLITG